MRSTPQNHGFSLVELTTAMVTSLILVFSFSSVVVFSRKQLTDANTRVGLGFDQVLMDRYVRTKLTTTISDSMRIYSDADAEAASITSSSGSILRAVDADSTAYHIDCVGDRLQWMIGSINHAPVDCDISDLRFTEQPGIHGKTLEIHLNLTSGTDTLTCEWLLTLRN